MALDVGTRFGEFAFTLVEAMPEGSRIIGMDCEPETVAQAREKSAGKGVEFMVGDAAHMDFEDGVFELVAISNTLHHIEDYGAVLDEMLRVLRPGGYFMVNEMFSDNQNEAQQDVYKRQELLSRGSYDHDGVGSLILVDIGGATTDIHSALPELEKLTIEERGLVINNEKQFSYRTVEGNLGLRVSATGIPEAVGPNAVIRAMDGAFGVTPDEVLSFARHLEDCPEYVPQSEKEKSLERAMATCAVNTALRRHAGYYVEAADPVMGILAGAAMGRDLRNVGRVLCVGGIFVHSDPDKATRMVARCFEDPGISLLPLKEPQVILDRSYLLYAMGVLGKHYPDAALSFLKEYVGAAEE